MRYLLTALAIILCSYTVLAQQSNIQYSVPFEEPEDGWNKVLQLKNGNTFFFHFTKKDGIEINLYGKDRKIIGKKTITSDLWEPKKMRISNIEGLYEINGDAVIFLNQVLHRTPTLFRIVLDGNTGIKKDEREISTLKRYGAGAGYAMLYGGVDPNDFYIEKDPRSDCYAVVNFNGFAGETDERIEVVHYDGGHNVINRAFYDSPEGHFKYLRYIGMTVLGDKQVFLCSYGFNTKSSGDKDSRVIVSRLNKEDKNFTHKLLDFTDDFRDTKSIMQYNASTGTIQLLTLTLLKTKSKAFSNKSTTYYLTLMSYIDPQSLSIITAKPLLGEKLDAYANSNLGEKNGFMGLPQQIFVNEDNSTTVLMEEMTITERRNGSSVTYSTELGNIGIAELDERGAEKEGYAIAKAQTASGKIDPMYVSQKSKGLWSYRGTPTLAIATLNNNAFMSFDYINTADGKYVVFNDHPKNFNQTDPRKRIVVAFISEANTMCYKLDKGKIDKYYLFGKPSNDENSRFCYIESSHFLQETNTYATLMMERRGKNKMAKIAWVKFE